MRKAYRTGVFLSIPIKTRQLLLLESPVDHEEDFREVSLR